MLVYRREAAKPLGAAAREQIGGCTQRGHHSDLYGILANAADRNIAVVVPAALQLEHIKFELGSGGKHFTEVIRKHGIILEDQSEGACALRNHSMHESMR